MNKDNCETRNACFNAGRKGRQRVCRLTGESAATLGGLQCNAGGVSLDEVNECARLAARGISHRRSPSAPINKIG